MSDDLFAVFILSHGRPHNVKTLTTLQRQGYTGSLYIIIDNEDKTAGEYCKLFGKRVLMFDKAAIARTFDECDNFNIARKSVVYARNACFEIARQIGVQYFLQLDDDYTEFRYRFDADLGISSNRYYAKNLDRLFAIVLAYYQSIPALTIAFAQGGDFLGGIHARDQTRLWLKRKAMNSFFCSVDRPFQFVGRINEDVNTYVSLGHRGHLIFTFRNANLEQTQTQKQSGGMTELYEVSGTYIKSFYPVMLAPSCVRVDAMRSHHSRIHHRISWQNAVPVIMSEQYRKP